MTLLELAACLFAAHAVVGAIDGTQLHIKKYKLYSHPDSALEHRVHTFRAWTLSLTALVLFAVNTGGLLLWSAVLLLVIDLLLLGPLLVVLDDR